MSQTAPTLPTGPSQSYNWSLVGIARAAASEPVAWGLAVIVFLRPWRDGVTYPSFNTYFLWAILALMALWTSRLLLRGEPVRHLTGIFLLAAFLAVALVTSLWTIQVDQTYRTLLFWAGHFFIFVLCVNGLKTRRAVGIVLGAFVLSYFFNALWAIIHYEYMLPRMRELIRDYPQYLKTMFGADALTPELKHRLETNRAFGTLLFPNALAAVMLLGLPYVVGELRPTLKAWSAALDAEAGGHGLWSAVPKQKRLAISAVLALVAWFLTTASAFFLYPFLLLFITNDSNWLGHPVQVGLYLVLIPVAAGAFCLTIARMYGPRVLRLSIQSIVLPFSAFFGAIALWLTYSRGGLMGLFVATAIALVLCFAHRLPGGARLRKWAGAAIVVLAVGASLVPGASVAQDADTAPQATADSPAEWPVQSVDPSLSTDNISLEGRNLTAGDMANPSSFWLRITYWRVALRMIADNPLTGVGLGNFGTAFAKYQYLGAGDAQTAHNDYLQAFAETGVFGFLAFVGFWVWFALAGARRILRQTDAATRWLLSGMYAGVLAFLIHSLVDFNFYNTTLVTWVFVMAGLFFARADVEDGLADADSTTAQKARRQLVALPLLLAVALAMGAAVRIYFLDFALTGGSTAFAVAHVGERYELRQRADMIRYFLEELPATGPSPATAPSLGDTIVLIPNLADIRSFAELRVRTMNPPALRPLGVGEVPPPNTVVYIRDAKKARNVAAQWTEEWIERLKIADSIYPYVPEVPLRIFEWYDYLQGSESIAQKKADYTEACVIWAREGVRRNPEQAWFHTYLAKALWLRGQFLGGEEAVPLYYEGIGEYERAVELYPIGPQTWRQYGMALLKLGEGMNRASRTDEGEDLLRRSAEAMAEAERLERELPAARIPSLENALKAID